MFEFSLRSGSFRPKSAGAPACLRFERLEERVVASATSPAPGDPSTFTTLGPSSPSSCVPVIDSFTIAQYLPNRQVALTGHVQDPNPGCTVTFSGVATGTVSCDSSGNFSVTVTASQLGQIQATAYDFLGVASTPASVTVTNQPPVIQNFTAVRGANNVWTFTGTVVDEAPAGLTVGLSSCMPDLQSVNVQVSTGGTFTYSVQLNNPADQGTVTANCTDWWGAAATPVCFCV